MGENKSYDNEESGDEEYSDDDKNKSFYLKKW